MKLPVTESGILIPKEWLEGVQEVAVSREGDRIVLIPISAASTHRPRTRAEIDADLAEMANDPEYLAEARQIEAEFSIAQWEAFQQAESEE
jgi:virulence-associated protein VagC